MTTPNVPPAPATGGRLTSLDALRGFIMLWIMGGDSIGHALTKMEPTGLVGLLSTQLNHVDWEGFRFYDLIFPTFVFIIGISIVYSLARTVEREGRGAAVQRVLRRTVLLYGLGILYYGGWDQGWGHVRLLGVLQRLALCYGAAALLFLFFRPRGLVFWCAGLLLGYWALMALVPVPEFGTGNYAEGKNLANWIDAQYLPLRKWDGDHDPEGLLSTLPAIASCLLGVFAGLLMRDPRSTPNRKTLILVGAGIASIALGWVWSLQFPVIKKIWTSSYVLVAGGWSALLLAWFYWVIDVRGWALWARPMVWIGLNPILIYMLGSFLPFDEAAARVLGGPVEAFLNESVTAGLGEVAISVGGILLAIGICWFLDRRKIYVRV